MISFFHPDLNNGNPLYLRLSPMSVEWTYNINNQIYNTYAGQVVQILGINYDKLTITGRFGLEGPHGRNDDGSEPSNLWNYSKSSGREKDYRIGLTQLTSYFKDYFDIASQGVSYGASTRLSGNFNQVPMTVSYTGFIDPLEGNISTYASQAPQTATWSVYPVEFPSYSRSLQEFAPEWSITFEVEEADRNADPVSIRTEIDRIQNGIGYDSSRQYSDPLAFISTQDQNGQNVTRNLAFNMESPVNNINETFANFLPTLALENFNTNYSVGGYSAPQKDNIPRKALQKLKGIG